MGKVGRRLEVCGRARKEKGRVWGAYVRARVVFTFGDGPSSSLFLSQHGSGTRLQRWQPEERDRERENGEGDGVGGQTQPAVLHRERMRRRRAARKRAVARSAARKWETSREG